jgi:hypothetical protein
MSSLNDSARSTASGLLSMAIAMVACHKDNYLYCVGHASDPSCVDAMPSCSTSAQCSAPTAVCKLPDMTCVQCTPSEATACTGATPVCGDGHTCRSCTAHAECPSSACLPNGACGTDADANVAYVDPAGTDNTNCTLAAPCTLVSKALATNRPFVKFRGTTNEQVMLNRSVSFLADPGAKLTDTKNGILLKIDGPSTVAIYDLEITGASGVNSPGISLQAGNTATVSLIRVKLTDNTGGGLSATGGTLTVTQSTVTNNPGGGISITGTQLDITNTSISGNLVGGLTISNSRFVVVGNAFFNNGSSASTVGGVSIQTTQSAANRLEFNSFNKNLTQDGVGSAIQCIAGTFTARNNIMSGNGTLTNMEQTGGSCMHAYSIALPGSLPSGGTNVAQDPQFRNTVTGDLHIKPGSPAIRAAAPDSDLTGVASRDIDGDPRVSPADLGADQIPR